MIANSSLFERKVSLSLPSLSSSSSSSSSSTSKATSRHRGNRRCHYAWKEFLHGIVFCIICQTMWDIRIKGDGGRAEVQVIQQGGGERGGGGEELVFTQMEETQTQTELIAASSTRPETETEAEIFNVRHGREATGTRTITIDDTIGQQQQQQKHKDFLEIALSTGTDKVQGHTNLPTCLLKKEGCINPTSTREECRPWGHFYDTLYDNYLRKYATTPDSSDYYGPIQFLEIGHYQGKGFEAYTKYLEQGNGNTGSTNQHELHTMEISCLETGPQSEGKWPYRNTAIVNPRYQSLRKEERLHCGDASKYDTLLEMWETKMKRSRRPSSNTNTTTNANTNDHDTSSLLSSQPPPPPLMVVVDDGSHLATHMATSLFFWLPRLEPGGILVVEDIQPIATANLFRTHILPQVIKDLHWCGDEENNGLPDTRCFPQLQPFLAGVHCEMHICVFIRNEKPSSEPNERDSIMPVDAITNAQKCLFGPHS